jgi:hypothetical protein
MEDAADGQPAQIIAVIEVGDQHLQHRVGIAHRRGDVLQDGFKQRAQIVRRIFERLLATPVLALA